MALGKINLNVARAFIGRRVNLHLKDGSVLINVYVTDAKRERHNGKPAILFISRQKSSTMRVLLREIEWMEQLNPFMLINA